jgi:hypothetical protein
MLCHVTRNAMHHSHTCTPSRYHGIVFSVGVVGWWSRGDGDHDRIRKVREAVCTVRMTSTTTGTKRAGASSCSKATDCSGSRSRVMSSRRAVWC